MTRIDEQPTEQRAIARVRAALAARGLTDPRIREFDASTATAAEAAAAIGTTVERIVKSLVFVCGDTPVLVLASGTNRVDVDKLGALACAKARRANADEVRQTSGYAIGGVPPVGHPGHIKTFVDRDLLRFDEVWAAAGTPNSVFCVAPQTLVELTRGIVAEIAAAPS